MNTARGDLLDADALLTALDDGRVSAAGVDVWPVEPVPPEDPLAGHSRVVATPHAAFTTVDGLAELQESAATQMVDARIGRLPRHIVNPAVLAARTLHASVTRV